MGVIVETVFPTHAFHRGVCSRAFYVLQNFLLPRKIPSTRLISTGWPVLSLQGVFDQSVGIIDVLSETLLRTCVCRLKQFVVLSAYPASPPRPLPHCRERSRRGERILMLAVWRLDTSNETARSPVGFSHALQLEGKRQRRHQPFEQPKLRRLSCLSGSHCWTWRLGAQMSTVVVSLVEALSWWRKHSRCKELELSAQVISVGVISYYDGIIV